MSEKMKPYYQDEWVMQYCSDALRVLSELEGDSVDLLATDPPYGISFMGKDWDKALPDKEIWAECLRVLKAGSFAFVMSIPRADCLSRMIISLEDVGFEVNFTPIFWAYASGFPKAQNIGKAVDKRLGVEREVVGIKPGHEQFANRGNLSSVQSLKGTLGGEGGFDRPWMDDPEKVERYHQLTEANTPQARALDGSYGGFQPKPAVEVIIVAMKPLSEKTFVDQALKNQKGITWLDDCRIPYESEEDLEQANTIQGGKMPQPMDWDTPVRNEHPANPSGRFPANLLVSDDVLNDGRVIKAAPGGMTKFGGCFGSGDDVKSNAIYNDSGSFSRYFDLDKWWAKTFPFLIVPKASKSEKNKGIGYPVPRTEHGSTPRENEAQNKSPNSHPTVKPLKLMSYLITLGSRQGDTVLDPFGGSGTTALASKLLNRKCIISEIEEKYCEIAANRCRQMVFDLSEIK